MMIPVFDLTVRLLPDPRLTPEQREELKIDKDDGWERVPIVAGWAGGKYSDKIPTAENLNDAEENAIRYAEHMIREAFARFRARGNDMSPWTAKNKET